MQSMRCDLVLICYLSATYGEAMTKNIALEKATMLVKVSFSYLPSFFLQVLLTLPFLMVQFINKNEQNHYR